MTAFPNKRFDGAQPITLNNKTFFKEMNYHLSYKFDGKRRLVYIMGADDIYYKVSKTPTVKHNLVLPKKNIQKLYGTVIDCEYVDGKYYVFDILRHKGKDLTRNTPFSIRYSIYRNVVREISSKKIISKIFYLSDPKSTKLYDTFEILEAQRSRFPMKTDGIIFTPEASYYHPKYKTLKWKPSEELTIDFTIKKITKDKTESKKYGLFDYYGKPINQINGLPENGKIIITIPEDFKIYSNSVYEFMYDKKQGFVPVRRREDKQRSNHPSVIDSNMKTILNPPDMKKILN